MSDQLSLGGISTDAKSKDPQFTWIEVLTADGRLAGHVLVDTTQIEAKGSYEDAKVAIFDALQARVKDRGFDIVEQEIRLNALELHID